MLSNYFIINNSFNYTDKEINDFKTEKNVIITNYVNDDRTVCNMLRNINLLTQNKFLDIIIKIIKYVNDAVLHLRTYNVNFDSNWWKNKHHIKHTRSIFNNYYLEISKTKIFMDHCVFNQFLLLSNLISDENIKSLILEAVYYTYKINIKIYEYENINKKLTNSGVEYTQHWNDILKLINSLDMKIYNPYILSAYEIIQNKTQFTIKCIVNGKTTTVNSQNEFIRAVDYSLKEQFNLMKNNTYDTVIELGSGFGRNMFYFASNILKDFNGNIIMGEYTPGGIMTSKYIKEKFFIDKNIKTYHFDYNNSDLFFEQIKTDQHISNVLILTFWSIEQITNITDNLIQNILNSGKKVTCVNLEPVGWQISNNSVMKENIVGYRSYYNKNLYETLKRFEEKKLIKINKIMLDYFNFGCADSCGTLIEWEKLT
jgi:hypothetical protein